MCGIAGRLVFGREAGRPPADTIALLNAMRETMVHRGPHGSGTWIDDDGRVGLAHRRLAIVDLAENAGQPMANEDGTIRVTFNGEIYNHALLRRELTVAGHRFVTDHADTEVIVHGYEEWGPEGLLERLDGMFAFAVWDGGRGRLMLARDRVGIKPLYFASHRAEFVFASEIKAILADPDMLRAVEPAALNHYQSFLVAPAPLTMFRGIYKLPAGHWMELSRDGEMRARRYWDAVPTTAVPEDEDSRVSDIRRLFEDAVGKRMMSDVPVGVFLSGGIDSSANVAMMSRLMDEPVNSFTVGFSDHRHLNETEHAERVARHFGTRHHEVLIGEPDMIGCLDDLVYSQDEPIADWVCIPLYFVSRLARDHGVRVVHVGEGSDEQFCGYRSYMMFLSLYRRFWNPYTRTVPKFLQGWLASAAAGLPIPRVADILGRAANGHELFWSGAHAIWNGRKSAMLRDGALGAPTDFSSLRDAGFDVAGLQSSDSGDLVDAYLAPFDRDHGPADALTRMIHLEFRLRLPELLLMRVDKITMSASVEARVPFLDPALVEYTMGIPMDAKVKGGSPKHLLKRALADLLPEEVLNRPKMGFGAPMSQWLRGGFGKRAEAMVLDSRLVRDGPFRADALATLFREHLAGRRDHALTLWTVFNFVAWHERWIEGQVP